MNDQTPQPVSADTLTLRDFLQVVRRRKLIILTATIVVPIVAVVLALRKPDLYEATASVLINTNQTVAAQVVGVPDTSAGTDPITYAQTQAFLASSPNVAKLVVAQAKLDHIPLTADTFLGQASVSPASDPDILNFSVVDEDPSLAAKLVNIYASQFTAYRQQLDTDGIEQASATLTREIDTLQGEKGESAASLLDTLSAREQQLQTIKALQENNTYFARAAGYGIQIQPRPKRDGLLGLGLGIVLGIALAFVREAIDTRIRTAAEVGERLGLPILGRVIEPSRRARSGYELTMLVEPHSPRSEAFRILRTNIELANVERRARLLLITSAFEAEGKSTTTSNLAVAMALAGRQVIVVDLDLRRPSMDRFFGLDEGRLGLTDVALGDITLDQALRSVPLGESDESMVAAGDLSVLPAGTVPPDPGEWVGNLVVADILEELALRADIVLIDSPPLLQVGDAMALSARVDAMLLVVRLSRARRGSLSELKRVLATTPTPKLGFIVTDAAQESDSDLGYYRARAYAPGYAPTTKRKRHKDQVK